MAELLGTIQDEELIGMTWDSQHIMNVLSEVVRVFRSQEKRIGELEMKIQTMAKHDYVETLKSGLETFETEISSKYDDMDKLINQNRRAAENNFAELKESIETQSLANLGEARRLITSEMSNYIPTLSLTDPVLSKINDQVTENTSNISKLFGEIDVVSIPAVTTGMSPEQIAGIRVAQCEKRISDIEKSLLSYPSIENDVQNLQLQFPASIRRLERKMTDLQTTQQTQRRLSATSPTILRNWQSGGISIAPGHKETPKNPFEVIVAEPEARADKPVKEDEPEEAIEELPQFTMPMKPQEEIKELPPMTIPTPLTAPQAQPVQRTAPTRYEPIVHVIEQKTYKTELASSVRVVSELEWTKEMLQQHHNAIRQLQQTVRTQQDNFDTLTENTMRTNTTTNARLAQLAQQQSNAQEELVSMKRQLLEQISHVSSRVAAPAPQQTQAQEQTQQHEKFVAEESTARSRRSSRSSCRKLDVLPPLPTKSMTVASAWSQCDESSRQDPLISTQRTAGTAESSEPQVVKEEPRTVVPAIPQFTTPRSNPTSPTKVTTPKRTEPESKSDMFVSPPSPVKTVVHHVYHEHAPRYSDLQQPEQAAPIEQQQQQPASIVKENYISIGGRVPGRITSASSKDPDIPETTLQLMEEQVYIQARKIVTIMLDSAKDDIKKQSKEVQKTVDSVVSLIDGKIDRDFVERMFNKFRVMLTEMNEKIDNIQCSFLEWVTRDELELVLEKFLGVVSDVKDAAATKTKYNCLLCGKPRNHLAGMMIGEDAASRAITTCKPRRRAAPAPAPTPANEPVVQGGAKSRDIVQLLVK